MAGKGRQTDKVSEAAKRKLRVVFSRNRSPLPLRVAKLVLLLSITLRLYGTRWFRLWIFGPPLAGLATHLSTDTRYAAGRGLGRVERRGGGDAEGGLGMKASKVLVTGGTGSLGGRAVDRLRDSEHDVRVLSRSGRLGTVRGNLLTGEGLEGTVEGAGTIVHCASSPTKTG